MSRIWETGDISPTTWEDRQCVTGYPMREGQLLTCTCILPSLLDQNDVVQGFEEEMAWTMIAVRKTEGQCYSEQVSFAVSVGLFWHDSRSLLAIGPVLL
jgi:hypothetical protein